METQHNDTKNDNKNVTISTTLYADCRYDECRGASLTSWIPYTRSNVGKPFTSVMYKCL